MRYSYLAMQKLLFDMDSRKAVKPKSKQKIADEVGEKYSAILYQTENHTTADFKLSMHPAIVPVDSLGTKSMKCFPDGFWAKLASRFAVYGLPLIVVVPYVIATYGVW